MLALYIRNFVQRAVLVTMLSGFGIAQAAISLSTTRVIFDGDAKEASVIVRNGNTDGDILIQSWVESNTPDDEGELPFAITPPLAKMSSGGQQLVRVLYAGGVNELPSDKESVLWLNVQEIPQTSNGNNTLQLAIRQRIKMFYRPAGLVGTAQKAPQELQWSLTEQSGKQILHIENPSAYYVTITGMSLGSDANSPRINNAYMIAPSESVDIPVQRVSANGALLFTTVNDYGGANQYEVHMKSGKAVDIRQIDNKN